jgi:hypothetical protein
MFVKSLSITQMYTYAGVIGLYRYEATVVRLNPKFYCIYNYAIMGQNN